MEVGWATPSQLVWHTGSWTVRHSASLKVRMSNSMTAWQYDIVTVVTIFLSGFYSDTPIVWNSGSEPKLQSINQRGPTKSKRNKITIMWVILNLEGHQNRITCSRITAILLKKWIFPIGQSAEASRWRVCYQHGLIKVTWILSNFDSIITSWLLNIETLLFGFPHHFFLSDSIKLFR